MKAILGLATLLCGLSVASSVAPARADADSDAWVKQCASDYKREGSTPEGVTKYCSCVFGLMTTEETSSVTEWEKAHPTDKATCNQASGWK
jgi:hypothetical protein